MMRELFKNLSDEDIKTTASFARGEVLPITQVPIEAFSKKKWEDGFGLLLEGEISRIYAPLDGVVSYVSANGNEYHIKGDNGLEVLIHLGVDTDDLDASYFPTTVTVGQKVKAAEEIGIMRLKEVKECRKCPVSYLIFLSGEEVRLRKHHAEVNQLDQTFFWCAKVSRLD